MADEKPKKTRTTTRAPRKRASDQTASEAAPIDADANRNETRASETPVLAIEQSSEIIVQLPDDDDEIRRQAYELYVSRGAADGDDLSDWLEAERIVRSRRGGAGEATDRTRR